MTAKTIDYVITLHQDHLSKTTKHWDSFVSHCIMKCFHCTGLPINNGNFIAPRLAMDKLDISAGQSNLKNAISNWGPASPLMIDSTGPSKMGYFQDRWSHVQWRNLLKGLATSLKRTFTDRQTSTPPLSPEKKKAKLLIRTALEKSLKGLMRFLKKCTPTEHHIQVQRAAEEENEQYEARGQVLDAEGWENTRGG